MGGDDKRPVYLDADKCNGCVSCMKRCPTEAIRVRDGKAAIMYDRCVGCGECVKICPTQAKKENYDKLSSVKKYEYRVAVPSPSVYGQFNNLTDVNYLLTGLLSMGFHKVVEVGEAAEVISAATRSYLCDEQATLPVISSACPAIKNLIMMRYEHLIPHLSPLMQPETLAVRMAVTQAMQETGLKRSKIGVFVITQCAANVMQLRGGDADGILSFSELYIPLLAEMNKVTAPQKIGKCSRLGVSWGTSTGEAAGLGIDNYLAADGIENVMTVLSDLEHEKLNNLKFLELYACTSGCVGGSMNIENPFLARTRLRILRKNAPPAVFENVEWKGYCRDEIYKPNNIYKLDENRAEAMKKMLAVKQIYESLPKLNCGACGAPNCMALAEDIVKGLDVYCKYRSEKRDG